MGLTWRSVVIACVALLAGARIGIGGETNAALFSDANLPHLQIELMPDAIASLKRNPRAYVEATFREGTNVFRDVAVRLKGRKGSFRKLDDKPAMTVVFDRFVKGRSFRGLTKLHLNNSVEDPSFLHELIGAELFVNAGVPAPRVGHALVELNGRRLGLFVVKEGFAPEFLSRHFRRADGGLFEPEPGPGADVDGPMRSALNTDGSAARALRRMAEVSVLPGADARWQGLESVLDVDRFVSLLALEILIGHRDGYALAKNNYRVYHDPEADLLVFLPAGMDQLFGRTKTTLWPHPSGIVARAVMDSSEGRRALHRRMEVVFTNVLRVDALTNQIRQTSRWLATQLTRSAGRALLLEADDLCERIVARAKTVEQEIKRSPPGPVEFLGNMAALRDWRATGSPEKGKMERLTTDGRSQLHAVAGLRTSAAWRTKVWLLPGRYRFEATARLSGVRSVTGARNTGVYLSVTGHGNRGAVGMTGDSEKSLLVAEFDVAQEDKSVELICHFRASAGEIWFDESSMRLVRLAKP